MTFIIITLTLIVIGIAALVIIAGLVDSEANKNSVVIATMCALAVIFTVSVYAKAALEQVEQHNRQLEYIESGIWMIRSFQESQRYEEMYRRHQEQMQIQEGTAS